MRLSCDLSVGGLAAWQAACGLHGIQKELGKDLQAAWSIKDAEFSSYRMGISAAYGCRSKACGESSQQNWRILEVPGGIIVSVVII